MSDFIQFLQTALGAPTSKLFIVFGLLFLGVAIVGSVTGYIKPGLIGRILGGLTGPMLIMIGLGMDMSMPYTPPVEASVAAAPATATPVPTATPTRASALRDAWLDEDDEDDYYEGEEDFEDDYADDDDHDYFSDNEDAFDRRQAATDAAIRRQLALQQLRLIQQQYDRKVFGLLGD
jgi:hypothetical protein